MHGADAHGGPALKCHCLQVSQKCLELGNLAYGQLADGFFNAMTNYNTASSSESKPTSNKQGVVQNCRRVTTLLRRIQWEVDASSGL